MKTKWSRVIEGVLVVAVVVVLGAIFYPVQAGDGRRAYASADVSNVKQLATAFLIYEADYDDCLPPEKGWLDTLFPYTKNNQIAVCTGLKVPSEGKFFGHAMSHGAGGLNAAKTPHPDLTLVAFDSVALAKSAVSDPWQMPVPGRIDGKNCVAFMDGHAKMVTPGEISR